MRLFCILALLPSLALAHDTWIEPRTNLVRTGGWVGLNLMLGNHGNEHRDFKLASKVKPGQQQLFVVGPDGRLIDLTPSLVDEGYTAQDGFWSGRFVTSVAGLYTAVSVFDQVMTYGPVRDIKSAKTFFVASDSLDKVPEGHKGFDRVFGHAFELVPMVNPVAPMGPGQAFKAKLLFSGQPLAGCKVSFIPKGEVLTGELDPRYEALTGVDGTVTFTPKEGNVYLMTAHLRKEEKGEGYESINYGATLCLVVPSICPCCGG